MSRALTRWAGLSLVALAFTALAQVPVPAALSLGGNKLQFKPESLEEELGVGKLVAAQITGAAPLLPQPGLQKYVNLVGRRLADQADRKELNWAFGVVDSSALNAFAAPGGFILLTSALLQILDTEDELAAVLAHEVAHVTRKHYYHVIRKQQMLQFGANAVAIGSANAEMANRMSGLVAQVMARGLDQAAEYEADRDGMVYAARAGYDASALIRVLDKLAVAAPKSEAGSLWLATHPSASDRSLAMARAVNAELDAAAVLSQAAPRLAGQFKK